MYNKYIKILRYAEISMCREGMPFATFPPSPGENCPPTAWVRQGPTTADQDPMKRSHTSSLTKPRGGTASLVKRDVHYKLLFIRVHVLYNGEIHLFINLVEWNAVGFLCWCSLRMRLGFPAPPPGRRPFTILGSSAGCRGSTGTRPPFGPLGAFPRDIVPELEYKKNEYQRPVQDILISIQKHGAIRPCRTLMCPSSNTQHSSNGF